MSLNLLKGGSETSLSMGALLGEPPLLRTLKVMEGRLYGWASFVMGAQSGQPGVGSCIRDFGTCLRRALGVECLFGSSGGKAPLLGTLKYIGCFTTCGHYCRRSL